MWCGGRGAQGSISCNSKQPIGSVIPATLCNGGATSQTLQFVLDNTLSSNYTPSAIQVFVGATDQTIPCTGVQFVSKLLSQHIPIVQCAFDTPGSKAPLLIKVLYNGTSIQTLPLSSASEALTFSEKPQITSVTGCNGSPDGAPSNATFVCTTPIERPTD